MNPNEYICIISTKLHYLFMRLYVLSISIILFGCNSQEYKSSDQAKQVATPVQYDDSCAIDISDSTITMQVQINDTNYLDHNNLKQGLWLDTIDGTVYISENYKDGKLHGIRIKSFGAERHVQEYQNGQKHGLYKWYISDLSNCHYTAFHRNDTLIWTLFNWDINANIVPVKGFIANVDSIPIEIYYDTGELNYKGILSDRNQYNAIGEHTCYYRNGNIKAIINYDSLNLKIFRKSGELYHHGKLGSLPIGQGYNLDKE